MQEFKNDELVATSTGSQDALLAKAYRNKAAGKTDKFCIASFTKGEVVQIKGLKFRITYAKGKKINAKLI